MAGTDWRYEPIHQRPVDELAANNRLMNAARTQLYRQIRHWLVTRCDFRVQGLGVFRQAEQFVLIANHASHLDTICLLAAMPKRLRNRCYAAAAADYFYTDPLKAQTARLIANTFPFNREKQSAQGLQACARILARGDSLLFFPEGTRSTTGELQRFRKGIGLLVAGTRYGVIPAHIEGAYAAWPKGELLPRPAKIRVHLGKPERFLHVEPSDASAITIADYLHDRVAALQPH